MLYVVGHNLYNIQIRLRLTIWLQIIVSSCTRCPMISRPLRLWQEPRPFTRHIVVRDALSIASESFSTLDVGHLLFRSNMPCQPSWVECIEVVHIDWRAARPWPSPAVIKISQPWKYGCAKFASMKTNAIIHVCAVHVSRRTHTAGSVRSLQHVTTHVMPPLPFPPRPSSDRRTYLMQHAHVA